MIEQARAVRILLVEDDDVDAMAVSRAFAKNRILNEIVRAKDGAEGLDKLAELSGGHGAPVIVLLDLNLPKINGIQFLERLRTNPAMKGTVVFVLTTSEDDRDKAAAYDNFVAGYMVKSNVGRDFLNLMTMLDAYWRVVEFPNAD